MKGGAAKNYNGSNARKSILRVVLGDRNHRRGLGKARGLIDDPLQYPTIVEALAGPSTSALLAANPFPKTFSQFQIRPRLPRVSEAGEFIWTASILSLYTEQLSRFSHLRECFENALVYGDIRTAKAVMDDIEGDLGVSIWLIANRIRLLQLSDGLSAQKDYLEAILRTKGLNTYAAYFAFYFSLRSEDNVYPANMEDDLHELLSAPGLGDYTRYHITPYDLSKIQRISSLIATEETQTLIDRFEMLVTMSQLRVSRSGTAESGHVLAAIGGLQEVNDRRLAKLLALFSSDPICSNPDEPSVRAFDYYTEGRYQDAVTVPSLFELKARSQLLSYEVARDRNDGALSAQIVSCMREILEVSSDYTSAMQQLKKLALFCSGLEIAAGISAFIERTHDFTLAKSHSELERIAAVKGYLDNPWHSTLFSDLTRNPSYLDMLMGHHGASSSLRLRKILDGTRQDAAAAFSEIALPLHRRLMYDGHLAMREQNYPLAQECYREAERTTNQYISNCAKAYLFKALYSEGLIADCLELVVEHYLSNPNAFRLYPIEKLTLATLEILDLQGQPATAILLHVASRHLSPRWERELSDVYENVLDSVGAKVPTDLIHATSPIRVDRLIYFLRFVCIPRIMDDSTAFSSYSDVENQRIAICQHLIELDPGNADMYSAEIRAITRDANIAQLLRQVESSKIFVDEAGVKSVVEDSMREWYSRYKKVLELPDLEHQAEKLSKIFEELLAHNEVKNLRLPASEREGLFANMLHLFVQQFAVNPAFGLDTHLSTAIRHGAFEGHVRSPLSKYDLLCTVDMPSGQCLLPRRWMDCFNTLSANEAQQLTKQLEKFGLTILQIIDQFRSELLQMRGENDHLRGLFNFYTPPDVRIELMKSITIRTTYEDFIEILMAYCWRVTDESLRSVQEELKIALSQINHLFDMLMAVVDSSASRDTLGEFHDAIVRARTELQASIGHISGWFKKPTDLRREPFELDVAIGVALKQIGNCYVRSQFIPHQVINVKTRIPGRLLDGMVEIFFLLLQNVIRHSGFDGPPCGVSIRAESSGGKLTITVENDLAEAVDIEERRKTVAESLQAYGSSAAMTMARQEGGSGLSKVWRILEYDFKLMHELTLEVGENHSFCARLTMHGPGMEQENAN